MPYTAEISRVNPSCFLFLIDQSGSMSDLFPEVGCSKAQGLADAVNRLLQTLATRCAKGEEVRDYFDVGVIGYGQNIGPVLQGPLAGRDLVSISEIAFNPAKLETKIRKVPDGAGGLVEQNFQLPIWLDPVHNGGTPMCEALRRAKSLLEGWVVAHPTSYPPTVIHITDGESTDGDPSIDFQKKILAG
ncbi:MAG: VWA domain-containing protein [Acidobacteria bacterium]|nr:VWA domain-containing protein [Acidobacteriota bacterium]